jgi:hypothetical protein
VSIQSSIRRVRRHREILAHKEIRERVLAYIAERTKDSDGHRLWTGLTEKNGDGTPRGHIWAPVVWNDGTSSVSPQFDPRLVTWMVAGLPVDDTVVILPVCGQRLCLSHLAAVPWVELGPEA